MVIPSIINDELSNYLSKLSDLVAAYSPSKEYLRDLFFSAVMISIILIGLIVIQSIGLLAGIILLGFALIGITPILVHGFENYKCHPSSKVYSEEACCLMNYCVNLCKYPGNDPESVSCRMILTYGRNGNLPLYKEFISIFPHMASTKLKKLSSIKLGY